MTIDYVVISAVRDEERYIGMTLRSVVEQSIRPSAWMIVDDGSVDETARIVDEFARQYPWIHLLRRSNRGYRLSGAGVIDAFNDGFTALPAGSWQFLVKLDGDLSFPSDYFERLFQEFERNAQLGIAGGELLHKTSGGTIPERCPDFHVRGATKVYRRECWNDIGGLISSPGWDIVDETAAQMHGWTTRSFVKINAVHHRPTGTAESKWKDQIKNGRAYYVAGYHPLFMLAKCVYRLLSRPYLVGSAAMAYGYVSARITGRPRQIPDYALVRFVRRQQMRRLLGMSTMWK